MTAHEFVDSFCTGGGNHTLNTWEAGFSEFKVGRFTPCFEDIALLGSTHVVIIILCLFRLFVLRCQRGLQGFKFTEISAIRWAKFQLALCILLVLVPVLQLNARVAQNGLSVAPFEYVSLALSIAAWIGITSVLASEMQRFVYRAAFVRRLAVVMNVAVKAIKVSTVAKTESHTNYFLVIFFVGFAFECILTLLALLHWPKETVEISDDYQEVLMHQVLDEESRPDGDTMECPEARAGLFSLMSFSWLSPLMQLGHQRPLENKDIFKLAGPDTASVLAQEFETNWSEECLRYSPSLVRTLRRQFGARFAFGGFLKIGNDASQFVGPIFLGLLIKFVGDDEAPNSRGYEYAFAIFLGQILGALSEAQYFQVCQRVGMQARSVLVSAIFRKSMYLSAADRTGMDYGKINNLMTSDVENVNLLAQNFHILWSSPLRIVISIVLLYRELGWASLVGAVFLLLLLPVQKRVVGKAAKYLKTSLGAQDQRVKLASEIMASAALVKMYSWEVPFAKRVQELRDIELSWLRKFAYLNAVNFALVFSVPVLVSVVAFGVFVAAGHTLTPAIAFTSISLYAVLRMPLVLLPATIGRFAAVRVSMERLGDFLSREEVKLDPNPPQQVGEPDVLINGGEFSWATNNNHEHDDNGAGGAGENMVHIGSGLHNVYFEAPHGALIAVVGQTGSGKSSLLSAILGDMPMAAGERQVRGSVAYVPQTSWIFNATIRENILFGLPYDRARYERAVAVSGLTRDLTLFASGDKTEIGERGVNLSGGQRQRVSIARAVYSRADVYLFDDPLSALDAHVGKDVFHQCILRELKQRTRVLVTNQLQFVPKCDYVVFMHDGRIEAQGTYARMMDKSPAFAALMKGHASSTAEEDDEGYDGTVAELSGAGGDLDEKDGYLDSPVKKRGSSFVEPKLASSFSLNGGSDGAQKPSKDASDTKLIVKEEMERGVVSAKVVKGYIKSVGSNWAVAAILFCYVFAECCRNGGSYWVSVWTGDKLTGYSSGFYIAVYGAWSGGQALAILFSQIVVAFAGLKASKSLHDGMLKRLLRAPMNFFHETPLGRITNRFTRDVGDADKQLASMTGVFISGFFQLIGTMAVIGATTPYTLVAFIPVMYVFWKVQRYFQATSRELKRLDSVTRSPVYALFSQTLDGTSSIRAYRAHHRQAAACAGKLDTSVRIQLAMFSSNRWLAIRLELLGGLMVLAAAIFVVVQRHHMSPALAGLALSYALQITGLLNMNVRLGSVAENAFNSVERIQFYSEVRQEAPPIVPGNRPPENWPSRGAIAFNHVWMRYRPHLPPVLRGLTFEVRPREKIGIVGRTGAGKSSVFLTLFRIQEVQSGTITIDNRSLQRMGLYDVRSRISFIPQEPVLFSGSVRFNLDPHNEHSDEELWDALDKASLRRFIEDAPQGLDYVVESGGDNFSVGQRQLLCLARALLRRTKIVVLDEASASVDVDTDALIQAALRQHFEHATMLVIAHRLETIIDSTRVMVLDAGQQVEFDTPAALLSKEDGIFRGMVDATGPEMASFLTSVANGEQDITATFSQDAIKAKRTLMRHRSLGDLEAKEDDDFGGDKLRQVREAVLTLRSALLPKSGDSRSGDGGAEGQGEDEEELSQEQLRAEVASYLEQLNALSKRVG